MSVPKQLAQGNFTIVYIREIADGQNTSSIVLIISPFVWLQVFAPVLLLFAPVWQLLRQVIK